MKYVSLTFDDGRRDNYTYAYPIMRKRNLPGTLFCTTGYMDGTWKKPAAWASAGEVITVEQLKEMQEAGWEIALHGDKHTTNVEDFRVASEKMLKWGFTKRPIGFSIPNSSVAQEALKALTDAYLGPELAYIRAGRAINTKSLTARILFAMYTFGHIQWAYNRFNRPSLMQTKGIDRRKIYSVVVRYKDDPRMIVKFLEQAPEDTWVVLMLHSVLPSSDEHYGKDAWCWETGKFEKLCDALCNMKERENVQVETIENTIIGK